MSRRVRLCEVPDCGRQHHCRGYCRMHYTRWYRHGDPRVQKHVHPTKTNVIPHGTAHGYGHWKCRCESCTEYARKRSADWARRNPSKIRERHLQRTYGLRPGQFEEMLAAQNGVCAICGQGPSLGTKFLHVDHDHDSGIIRGLLCHLCNIGLGSFGEDYERLAAAMRYLAQCADRSAVA